jgi:hypothetical protein
MSVSAVAGSWRRRRSKNDRPCPVGLMTSDGPSVGRVPRPTHHGLPSMQGPTDKAATRFVRLGFRTEGVPLTPEFSTKVSVPRLSPLIPGIGRHCEVVLIKVIDMIVESQSSLFGPRDVQSRDIASAKAVASRFLFSEEPTTSSSNARAVALAWDKAVAEFNACVQDASMSIGASAGSSWHIRVIMTSPEAPSPQSVLLLPAMESFTELFRQRLNRIRVVDTPFAAAAYAQFREHTRRTSMCFYE